ncbi:Uu.00g089730.m01.CDS01 [Anthostomella pinea]|uniref:Uu.00g089730.m01.CDS01 n=1 Tax=Anthostomella pinea TaxID=933095 RepID=A0AAI8YK85_9PEZI|nr:Uu.00g089730.m01.CDS01 [Anthostomella pinea]
MKFQSIITLVPLLSPTIAVSVQEVTQQISRRHLSIKSDAKSGRVPWPGGEVTWCIDNPRDYPDYKVFIDMAASAINLWMKALGDDTSLEVSPSDNAKPECDSDNAGDMLRIRLNNKDNNQAYVGFTKGNNYMDFDPFRAESKISLVAKLAHEFGHVFGLYHEHQDPTTWGELKINYENLRDWKKFEKNGKKMDHKTASEAGFSAANLLPYDKIALPGMDSDGRLDWKSIMLYPSENYAKNPKKGALVKANGQLIQRNLKPSKKDAKRVCELYPASNDESDD